MTEKLVEIPTLDSLMADPAKAMTLPPEVAQSLLIGLVSLQPLLMSRAMMGSDPPAAGHAERFLSVEEAVSQYGVTASWLYRHKRQLPHSQPSRKVLLFPEEKLRRWFAARKMG
jgi:predicted DNA-binding transcriptional regulator AlpA